MESVVIWLCIAVIGYVLLKLSGRKSKQQEVGLPPRVPGAIPFLGNITGLDRKRPHVTLSQWSQLHGDVFRLTLLGENIIVVNSWEAIEEVLNKGSAFAGRPSIFRINYGFHYGADVIFGTFNPKWVAMKRLVVCGIREVGRNSLGQDALELCGAFKEKGSGVFDPSGDVTAVVVSALCQDILGKKLPLDHPQLQAFTHMTRLFSEACSPIDGMELDLFPWLRFFGSGSFQKLKHARAALDVWVDAEMEEAIGQYKEGTAQSLFDIFYQAHRESQTGSDVRITLTDVRGLLIDMLISSTYTTAVAVKAFCLFMAMSPEIQQKLRSEVVSVCGKLCVPDYNRREDLPLLEASVQEVLRLISHVPLSLPHFTTETTSVQGYCVPKHTQVLLNLWHMHHDERIWKDAWTFQPERFLKSNNNQNPCSLHCAKECDRLTHTKTWRRVLPFSGGRRGCPGENTSRQRLFTMAGALVSHFEISPSQSLKENPDIADPRNFLLGLILEPQPFQIVLKEL